jgi:hypothetical protein
VSRSTSATETDLIFPAQLLQSKLLRVTDPRSKMRIADQPGIALGFLEVRDKVDS